MSVIYQNKYTVSLLKTEVFKIMTLNDNLEDVDTDNNLAVNNLKIFLKDINLLDDTLLNHSKIEEISDHVR